MRLPSPFTPTPAPTSFAPLNTSSTDADADAPPTRARCASDTCIVRGRRGSASTARYAEGGGRAPEREPDAERAARRMGAFDREGEEEEAGEGEDDAAVGDVSVIICGGSGGVSARCLSSFPSPSFSFASRTASCSMRTIASSPTTTPAGAVAGRPSSAAGPTRSGLSPPTRLSASRTATALCASGGDGAGRCARRARGRGVPCSSSLSPKDAEEVGEEGVVGVVGVVGVRGLVGLDGERGVIGEA